jgi:hypothetical protein
MNAGDGINLWFQIPCRALENSAFARGASAFGALGRAPGLLSGRTNCDKSKNCRRKLNIF